MPSTKLVENLTIADLQEFPVWQFCNIDEKGETAVRPVKRIPVTNLASKAVGTQVTLANGIKVWATISNVDPQSPRKTQHMITLVVHKDDRWFPLARYFDAGIDSYGPKALAHFLGMRIQDVFPITYDLTPYVKGDIAALRGTVEENPRERLTEREIIRLILNG